MVYLTFGIGNVSGTATAASAIVLKTASAGRISRNVDNPVVVIHHVLLVRARQI